MAHITLSQLTTVLQRIVSWAGGKFAAKNTYSGKLEYADMPVVVLASMGSELDGTSTQRPMSAGSTYFLPAEQGTSARIMFVTALGQPVKISDPDSGVIYCNAYTGLLYRWDSTTSQMVSVGGGGDGLRKVYVNIASSPADFSNLNALHSAETSGVYQVIDQSSQKIIGILVVSSDNNPYLVTQWLFSTLVLSDEFSGSLTNGQYTNGRAHIIHRFYKAGNAPYDIPLNTWSEWKVYGLTLDEMSEIFNSKVSSISVNGTNHTPDSNGVVDLGTIQGEKAGEVSVTTNQDGTFTIHAGGNDYTVNLNHTHENMAKLVVCEESDLPSTLDNDTIYCQVDDAEDPTEIQSLWIAGLEFVGGGGSEDDGLPKMSTPKDGNTINMGTYSGSAMTKEITVRAKNLNYGGSTTGLTVEAVGTGLTLTYGQTTGTSVTIPQTDAMIGAQLTINYSGTGALSDGELRFKQGSSVLAVVVVVVVVVVAIPSELVQDTAWCAASGENFSAPETQAGYCTTPFYQLTHDGSGNLDYIVKAGYVTPTDLARGMYVVKTNLNDAQTQGAYLQSSDPRRKQNSDNLHKINYLSATFKTSEWADCYIYDYIAGAYLFAGANVDTSTPPTMINPT